MEIYERTNFKNQLEEEEYLTNYKSLFFNKKESNLFWEKRKKAAGTKMDACEIANFLASELFMQQVKTTDGRTDKTHVTSQ